ncbi:MAG: hypothetical protein ACREJM_08260, partial [Candidatus Saccharimonadales bacterium]
WLDELRSMVRDHRSVEAPTWEDTPANNAHVANLLRRNREAVEAAPSGQDAIVLGAGALEDIPDELFSSEKFPTVLLVDIDMERLNRAIDRRGLRALVEAGRIVLIDADLSLINPEFVRELEQAVKLAANPAAVRLIITDLFSRWKGRSARLELPAALKGKKFGFVISSLAVPDIPTYAELAVVRMFARRLNRPLPHNLGASPFLAELRR